MSDDLDLPEWMEWALGKLISPGVSIKPHPSGSLSHPAMGEMLRLIRQNESDPAFVGVQIATLAKRHGGGPLR